MTFPEELQENEADKFLALNFIITNTIYSDLLLLRPKTKLRIKPVFIVQVSLFLTLSTNGVNGNIS